MWQLKLLRFFQFVLTIFSKFLQKNPLIVALCPSVTLSICPSVRQSVRNHFSQAQELQIQSFIATDFSNSLYPLANWECVKKTPPTNLFATIFTHGNRPIPINTDNVIVYFFAQVQVKKCPMLVFILSLRKKSLIKQAKSLTQLRSSMNSD